MPAATKTSPVRARLAALRDLPPQAAQDQAWTWLAELGKADDRAALAELFGAGTAESPRTVTAGMPVGAMRDMPGARVVNAVLAVDSPWTGKTFHADGSGGFNRVKLYAAPVVAALARRLQRTGAELTGFSFDTSVQAGVVEPHVDVLAIEYDDPRHGNPSRGFPLTRIRDELVEILPHTYLGRATWRRGAGDYVLVGYFALKRPVA